MIVALFALVLLTACAGGPGPRAAAVGVPRTDSALVRRILQAEDRRDTTALAALASQAGTDERMLLLARRAAWRIRDPRFALRDSLPPLPSPPRYAEPAWRLRYRALRTVAGNCTSLATALADSAWPVRLRALDVLTPPCSDAGVLQTLRAWVDDVPADASRRERGAVSWHAAAHSILALARLRDDGARDRVVRLSTHAQPELRVYAARAAAILADTQLLRAFDHDPDDNVKEAAIDALSKLTGHASDSLYIGALSSSGAPAVRAAALALVGSPVPGLRARLDTTFERWVARGNASERDVRVALLQAAGRPASDDRPPSTMAPLPASAAALALGQPRQLVVVMSPASGGGSFTIRLRGDVAPIMASRVLQLAKSGYYDGGHWHRVEPDFVIQGGGPGTNEYVGYREYLRDELGTVPHMRGTVGMSTRGHDSGDAQWFINLKDNLRLDADYTVFAEVVSGIEVVDGILEGDTIDRVYEVP